MITAVNKINKAKELFIAGIFLTGLILINACRSTPNATKKHIFKPGDKIYTTSGFVNNHMRTGMMTFRIIRPITLKDIDTMTLDPRKKQLLRQNFKPMFGIKLIGCAKAILNDSLRKYKTAFIGTYIKYLSKVHVSGESYTISVDGIILDPKVTVYNYYYKDDPIPANYTFADNITYVAEREISDKELPQFF